MVGRKLTAAIAVVAFMFTAGGAAATGVCIGDPRACDPRPGGGGGGGGTTNPFSNVVLSISNGFSGQSEQRSTSEPGKIEGDGVQEGQTCVFNVHRDGPAGKEASVQYKTKDGTAVAGGKSGDYAADEGTVFFKPNQRDAFIFIQTFFDPFSEPDEHFFVILKNPKKSVLGDRKGKCVIFANAGKGGPD